MRFLRVIQYDHFIGFVNIAILLLLIIFKEPFLVATICTHTVVSPRKFL